MTASKTIFSGVVVSLAAAGILLGGVYLTASGGDDPSLDTCVPQPVAVTNLDDEQSRNAATIVTVGQAAQVPARGLRIALATAYQESTLRNLDYGDRDSLGLFQQRPSTGWGTAAEITDSVYAARAFYGGPGGPNRGEPPGLLDVPGWESMTLAEAAQAVQRSAFPDAYAKWEDDAQAWLAEIYGSEGDSCSPGGGLSCPATGMDAEAGLTADAQRVLRCIKSEFPQITTFHGLGDRPNASDHPTGRAVDAMIPSWPTPEGNQLGWDIAEWVTEQATCLGVTYVIFDDNIWDVARAAEGWRPYEHPSGADDPTARHLNHVHVSVQGRAGSCADGEWTVPLRGDYTISARFGDPGARWATTHTGTDLAAPIGRPALAAAGGEVTFAGLDGAYGNKVEITHPDGTTTWYAHLSQLSVAQATQVQAGQEIGLVGASGNVTGPHLHFEVRTGSGGRPVDPEPWMAARGAPL